MRRRQLVVALAGSMTLAVGLARVEAQPGTDDEAGAETPGLLSDRAHMLRTVFDHGFRFRGDKISAGDDGNGVGLQYTYFLGRTWDSFRTEPDDEEDPYAESGPGRWGNKPVAGFAFTTEADYVYSEDTHMVAATGGVALVLLVVTLEGGVGYAYFTEQLGSGADAAKLSGLTGHFGASLEIPLSTHWAAFTQVMFRYFHAGWSRASWRLGLSYYWE